MSEAVLQWVGLILLFVFIAMLAVGLWMSALAANAKTDKIQSPMSELEFLKSVEPINEMFYGDKPDALPKMNRALQIDNWLFVPLYGGLMLFLAWLLGWRQQLGAAVFMAYLATVLTIIAAFADWGENYLIRQAINTKADWAIRNVAYAAYAKWLAAFAGTVILGLIFWRTNAVLLSYCLWLAVAGGVVGLFFHNALQIFFLLEFLVLFAASTIFISFPKAFLEKF